MSQPSHVRVLRPSSRSELEELEGELDALLAPIRLIVERFSPNVPSPRYSPELASALGDVGLVSAAALLGPDLRNLTSRRRLEALADAIDDLEGVLEWYEDMTAEEGTLGPPFEMCTYGELVEELAPPA